MRDEKSYPPETARRVREVESRLEQLEAKLRRLGIIPETIQQREMHTRRTRRAHRKKKTAVLAVIALATLVVLATAGVRTARMVVKK